MRRIDLLGRDGNYVLIGIAILWAGFTIQDPAGGFKLLLLTIAMVMSGLAVITLGIIYIIIGSKIHASIEKWRMTRRN